MQTDLADLFFVVFLSTYISGFISFTIRYINIYFLLLIVLYNLISVPFPFIKGSAV